MASESAIGATTAALPGTLGPLDTGGIAFKAGVPIGGWAQLTLHENGAYNFVGQLSNTGTVPYHVGCVWAIRDAKGSVYTFARDGVAHGWDPGSSEFGWNTSGQTLLSLQGGLISSRVPVAGGVGGHPLTSTCPLLSTAW